MAVGTARHGASGAVPGTCEWSAENEAACKGCLALGPLRELQVLKDAVATKDHKTEKLQLDIVAVEVQ